MQHITIDGVAKNKVLLNDKDFVRKLLLAITKKIRMTPVSSAQIYEFPKLKGESGLTGYLLLAESHISIHTYPESNMFYLDVFSCKKFSEKSVLKELKDLDLKSFDLKRIKRKSFR